MATKRKAKKKAVTEVTIKVSQDGSRLVTEGNLTLYYFLPQRFNPTHGGDDAIPWMSEWPYYLKSWIEDWDPLTGAAKLKGTKGDGLSKDDFKYVIRKGGPKNGEQQIMFRHWYLYTYKGDNPNQLNGEVNGVWHKVSPDMIDIGHYVDGEGLPEENFSGGP